MSESRAGTRRPRTGGWWSAAWLVMVTAVAVGLQAPASGEVGGASPGTPSSRRRCAERRFGAHLHRPRRRHGQVLGQQQRFRSSSARATRHRSGVSPATSPRLTPCRPRHRPHRRCRQRRLPTHVRPARRRHGQVLGRQRLPAASSAWATPTPARRRAPAPWVTASTAIDLGTGRTATALADRRLPHLRPARRRHTVKCWGNNSFGQLGLGNDQPARRGHRCRRDG